MFYIVMACAGELGFMTLGIFSKRLRNRGVHSLAVLGVQGLCAPLWLACIGVALARHELLLTPAYLLIWAGWMVVCFLLNFGSTYLAPFLSLSEATGYRFGFTVLLALLSDLLIFGQRFDAARIVAIALLLGGGLLLNFSRAPPATMQQGRSLGLRRKLPAFFLLSLVEVTTYTLFKRGAQLQAHHFFHTALFCGSLMAIYMALGWRARCRDGRSGLLPAATMALMALLVYAASVADGFAMAGLPVTLFVLFSLLRGVAFAGHDIRTGELRPSPGNSLAIVLILAGLVTVAVATVAR